jgi:hypothetical protein
MENVNEGDRGGEGDLLPPLQCDWDFPPQLLRGGGGQYNGLYYQEVGDENREVRAKVHCKATPGSLIDKLLNNPHASLQREPMRHRLPVETEHQQRLKSAVGHGRLDSTPVGDASLMAQRPLLDGGEGKLLPSYIDAMDNDTHVEQEIPPMDATTSNFLLLEFLPNIPGVEASNLSGLEPPSLDSTGGVVTGTATPKHRIENKRR